jgi:23S rRNA (uracil1939-C5)-methyltransferase
MTYEAQLKYKQQQVQDAFERIGKFPFPDITPILGSEKTRHYRNKLEYNFTHQKWLTNLNEKDLLTEKEHLGVGYHIPGRFDKVFEVNTCWLMDDLQNQIRNTVSTFCKENDYSFFNLYSQEGLMRSLILRNTVKGEWMLIVVFGNDGEEEKRIALMNMIHQTFPQIVSLLVVINNKRNDTIYDLEVSTFAGENHLIEFLEDLQFRIGPKSFFQTNTRQTLTLYSKTREFAKLTGKETVYDLYTGVGTIALFVARQAKKVIGLEYIESAITDADINATINGITNATFLAGDMKDVLNDELIKTHGKPDVIISDPPRAGMHEAVVQKILEVEPDRVVYVSCNPATQARDIAWMQEKYQVTAVQPVDMFPHTHHVENIALLELKK